MSYSMLVTINNTIRYLSHSNSIFLCWLQADFSLSSVSRFDIWFARRTNYVSYTLRFNASSKTLGTEDGLAHLKARLQLSPPAHLPIETKAREDRLASKPQTAYLKFISYGMTLLSYRLWLAITQYQIAT